MVNTKHVAGVVLLLLSAIVSGCINPDLKEPKTLSKAEKRAYSSINITDAVRKMDTYKDMSVTFSGKVSSVSYEGGKTTLVISAGASGNEPVIVYFKGRLPEKYQGLNVEVYGVIRGMDVVKNSYTGADINAPEVYAVQVIPVGVGAVPEPVKTVAPPFTQAAYTKTLALGENWQIGSGYELSVQALDAKAVPKQVWLVLFRNGTKLDDRVLAEGETYNYNNILSMVVLSISDEKIVLGDVRIASSEQ